MRSVLHYYGFSGSALNLLKSYFTDRQQIVKLENKTSSPIKLVRGVPQGSILGPLLFCIYTSLIHNDVKFCKIHTYADDTQMYASFNRNSLNFAINMINEDLQHIYAQSLKYELQLNPTKTQVVIFSSKNCYHDVCQLAKFKINNVNLDIVTEAKNLGIIIDHNLKYKQHISASIQRAFSALRQLYPLRHFLNSKVKANLCNTLVLSHFSHCSVVFSQS